tara:strand:- start:160 stop:330 length:171 start_codon:yes stop_codon:yes gene_type:complete
MPTGKMKKYIGVGCVIPAIVKKQGNVLVVLLHFRDQDTKRKKVVNCVALGHNIRYN